MIVVACAMLAFVLCGAEEGAAEDPKPGKDLGIQVTASAWEQKAHGGWADFPPERTLDGDMNQKSSWRAESKDGKGQWIRYDLKTPRKIEAVKLAFVQGDARKYRIKIETSGDGKSWVKTFEGQTSGKTTDFELFSTKGESARYVRVTGYGNTNEKFPDWINIVETRIVTE